ncbi:predicted protein [Sclerotinia sclerotiorum 1980 UF-70]|uniref:Uncharacterized protein n=1 Tax=Sclerotinia sclerotiorum (strain ATCC 18683 / 1980 / Ss-1) TaxID=665079 RepID=A7EXW5_SCLS1|nr:predicted protein [Sclerotinia sclerotiorum 1980 UF-70]EDN94307.1 predicted protein [Sclerotinia sclerotiorum 1980 UF-70]
MAMSLLNIPAPCSCCLNDAIKVREDMIGGSKAESGCIVEIEFAEEEEEAEERGEREKWVIARRGLVEIVGMKGGRI